MKRFLLAVGLAMVAHAFFLSIEVDWSKKKESQGLKPETLYLSLLYREPQRKVILRNKRNKKIHKRTILKPPEKIHPPAKPRIKIPPKKSRPLTVKSRQRPSEPKENIQPKPSPRGPVHSGTEPVSGHEIFEAYEEDMDIASIPEKKPEQGKGRGITEDGRSVTSVLPIREAIPAYQQNPHPQYPRIARRRGYEGTVVLEVLVDREGRVGDLRLFQSSGHHSLDRAALKSVANWVFVPGMKGERKVEMWVKVPIRFRLK